MMWKNIPTYEAKKIFVLVRKYAGEVEDKWEFKSELKREQALLDYSAGTSYSPEVTYSTYEYYRKEKVR